MLFPATDPAARAPSPEATSRPMGRWRMGLVAVLLALLAGWWLMAPSRAPAAGGDAGQAMAGTTRITARLVTERPAAPPGGTVMLAIAMRPQPGWHGYWSNGGDAGFGMRVRWTLPAGVTMGPLRYPVPGRLMIAGLMNHVYKAPYALLGQATLSSGLSPGARLPIVGTAEWLACTDMVCVPERGTLRAEIIVAAPGAPVGAADARFDGWRMALPRDVDRGGWWRADGAGRVRVQIPFPADAPVPDPHLFVAQPDVVAPAAPQRWSRKGDWLVMETGAARVAAPPTAPLDAVLSTGVIDTGGRAQGVAVPLARVAAGRGLPVDPTGATPIVPRADDGGWRLFALALGGAVLGGLILNVMPCVFPILSLKLMAVARGGGARTDVRREAWGYALGATGAAAALGAVLVALKAGGASLGWAFQLQHPAGVLVLVALVAAITANLAGWFVWPALATGGAGRAGRTPWRDGVATGALAGVVATPCGGPFMAAALGATLTLPAGPALMVFAGLGLGLSLPFVLLAHSDRLRASLPRPGPWMERVQRWLAVPMALTLAALLWLMWRQAGGIGLATAGAVVMAVGWAGLLAGRAQRRGAHAWPLALMAAMVAMLGVAVVATQPARSVVDMTGRDTPYDAARLDAWRRDGPVFVHFTADWCVTCKVNEAAAIDRPEVRRAFAAGGVRVMVADWTSGDPAITRALAAQGRNSVPLYLWYPAGGASPVVLPQILTPRLLIDRAKAEARP